MRTTPDIDEEILKAAKSIAGERNLSVGAVLSELARRELQPAVSPGRERKGFPVFEVSHGGTVLQCDNQEESHGFRGGSVGGRRSIDWPLAPYSTATRTSFNAGSVISSCRAAWPCLTRSPIRDAVLVFGTGELHHGYQRECWIQRLVTALMASRDAIFFPDGSEPGRNRGCPNCQSIGADGWHNFFCGKRNATGGHRPQRVTG